MITGAPVNVLDFGADPSGTSDSTVAIRAACAYLQSVGGGELDFGNGTYKVYTTTSDMAALGTFTNLIGLSIKSSGAKFIVNRSFAVPDVIIMFSIQSCSNVTVEDFEVTCSGTRTGALALYNSGIEFLNFSGTGNNYIIGNLIVSNAREGVSFNGPGICSNITISNIQAYQVGYPLFSSDSAHGLTANVLTDECGRSYFSYNARNHTISIVSKNNDASIDCLIYADGNATLAADRVCRDVKISYTNTETTNAIVGTKQAMAVYFRNEVPSVIENIDITLNVQNTVTGGFNVGLAIKKLTQAGGIDPVVRGHTIRNIKISGIVSLVGTGLDILSPEFLGETVSLFNFENLYITGGFAAIHMEGIQDQAVFKNVTCTSTLGAFGSSTTGRIVCIGVTTPNITVDITDSTVQDYYSCRITSDGGNTQSLINKNLHNVTINDVLFNQVYTAGAYVFKSDVNPYSGFTAFGSGSTNGASVYAYEDSLRLFSGGIQHLIMSANGDILAVVDNTQKLGTASFRWSEVFAGNGTINTSDEREKQDIIDLTTAEKQVAIAIKGLIRSFKFKSAVAKKGDKARIHVGVMAQQVAEAFKTAGLNPDNYSLFCYDEWTAQIDEDGKEISPAGNRYGIRYDQLLAFVISAL